MADLGRAPEVRALSRPPRLVRWIRAALAGLVTIYLGFALGFYLLQDRFILFPERGLASTPAALGLAYEECAFRSADGIELHGWYVPASGPQAWPKVRRPVVLFCHGNAGNIATRLDVARAMSGLGFDSFLFDYRGFGRSAEVRPDEAGLARDADGAWTYLTRDRGIAPERLVVYGQSLGAAVAAGLASRQRIGALVLEGGFPSLAAASALRFPWLPVRLLLRSRYPAAADLQRMRSPVLIAHSVEDRIVPPEMGRALFEAAREPKSWLSLKGEHVEAWTRVPQDYAPAFADFVRQAVSGAEADGPSPDERKER